MQKALPSVASGKRKSLVTFYYLTTSAAFSKEAQQQGIVHVESNKETLQSLVADLLGIKDEEDLSNQGRSPARLVIYIEDWLKQGYQELGIPGSSFKVPHFTYEIHINNAEDVCTSPINM